MSMSVAAEQPRALRGDRPTSGSHAAAAASLLNTNRNPDMSSSQPKDFLPSAAIHSSRSSYDSLHNYSYTSTMEDHKIEDQAPVLPPKSALRTSRLLDSLTALKVPKPAVAPTFTENPHDEYLSSEEEASSTAGDFSDLEYDSSSDEVSPSPTKECSTCEVTARVVSVIFSGKPVVVDVSQARRSVSPVLTEQRVIRSMLDIDDPVPSPDTEVKRRRLSSSTIASSRSSASKKSQVVHPPRTSSMLPPPHSSSPAAQSHPKPSFLRIDPYANRSTMSLVSHSLASQNLAGQERPVSRQTIEEERPKTPKTPTKMFKGVARAMSLMKRRSVPRLNQSYLAPSTDNLAAFPKSPSNGSIPEESTEEFPAVDNTETKDQVSAMPTLPSRPRPQLKSMASEDILRTARNNDTVDRHLSAHRTFTGDLSSPVSPGSPMSATSPNTIASGGRRMSTLGLARRRMSVKLTGKFQL